VKNKKFSERLLLAVELPRFAREHLVQGRKTWRKKIDGDIRWLPPLNLHLTLRFLGELEVSKSKLLSKNLATLAADTPVFQVSIGKLCALPTPKEARVVCLTIEDSDHLLKLVNDIESACQQLQLPKDKKSFQSQITLARSSEPQEIPDLKLSPGLKGFMVKNFSLIESRLGQNGPTYHPLKKFELQG
jgi:RNA 2',3'-cyclic 3'-phosphodiesterase